MRVELNWFTSIVRRDRFYLGYFGSNSIYCNITYMPSFVKIKLLNANQLENKKNVFDVSGKFPRDRKPLKKAQNLYSI